MKKKKRKRAVAPAAPTPAAAAPAEPASESPSSPSSTSELEELEKHFRAAQELEDAPPAIEQEIHEGAPPGGEQKPGAERPGIAAQEVGRNVAVAVFGLVALRLGAHWKLKDAEADVLASALEPLAARALAVVSGLWVELLIVGVVLWPMVQSRVEVDVEQARAAVAEHDKQQ